MYYQVSMKEMWFYSLAISKIMHLIEMEDVTKSYYLPNGDEIPVLKDIDLQIEKGSFVTLMWPSGSGKSTLLNIIWFLHPSSGGTYLYGEEDVSAFKDDTTLSYIRNRKCGFIFQQYFLIPRLTALQNVMLPAMYAWLSHKMRVDKAASILEQVGLGDKLANRPWELSGWQQQRVAIARALMNDPELILADEPTGALDSKNGAEVMELIQSFRAQGTTVIMVTHEQFIAEYADRIIYLKDGKVVEYDEVSDHFTDSDD